MSGWWSRVSARLGIGTDVPPRKHTRDVPIAALPVPSQVRLPLTGLTSLVSPGERVEAHALVARSPEAARWQRRLHAPLGGAVVRVDDAIVIDGGPATTAPTVARLHRPAEELDRDQITSIARDAGIVGLGGGMFPTYAKLLNPAAIDTVLINGCESEPYFTCDHRVLCEHRDEVECGLALAMRAVGARDGLVIDREDYYPAGYERFVVRDQLGRAIPARGLPRDVGALVLNVQSARALHRAVCLGEPLVSRVITVAGGAVGRPGNYHVLIGTPVADVLAACAVDERRTVALIAGGPMMGHVVTPTSTIGAGTGGILALARDEQPGREELPCIHCGRCVEACPVDLPVPLLLERPGPDVLNCIACGACQFVCPSAIPLVERLRAARAREVAWD